MAKTLLFQFRKQRYSFHFGMVFFLFCLFFLILFCLLGTWQLHRFHYKKTLLISQQTQSAAKPIPFLQIVHSKNILQFQPVTVEGLYINKLTMFVQNRLYKGQIGFDVLTPLRIPGEKKLLLVNRGWIKRPDSQKTERIDFLNVPTIANVENLQHITGSIKLLNEQPFILGKNIFDPRTSPIVMQKIDIEEISRITQESFFPFILRLDSTQPHGFMRDWIMTTIMPERHLGYALQWFVMALVLVIAYSCFSINRITDRK